MTISIIWSATSGGDAISDPKDCLTVAAGSSIIVQDLYVRATENTAKLTSCGWYIRPVDDYVGSEDATTDYNEIIAWGNANPSPVGGYKINQNTETGVPSYTVCETGVGVSSSPIDLHINSIVGGPGLVTGDLEVGEEAHIQVKIYPPSDEDTAGDRMIELVFYYVPTV